MFGRGWEAGQATIVALKEVWSAGHDASTDGGGPKLKTYEFLADVQPAAGRAMFRTVMHEPFDERVWVRPSVGDVVAVKCNPGREKAKFDMSGATAARKAQKEEENRERAAQAAQFDAMVDAAPGTPPPSPAPSPVGGPSGLQTTHRIGELMHEVARAREAGEADEVRRIQDQIAATGRPESPA
jgi:hypothetical protein